MLQSAHVNFLLLAETFHFVGAVALPYHVQIGSLNATMKKLAGLLLLLCGLATALAQAQSVAVLCPQPTPQCADAARKLGEALTGRGFTVGTARTDAERKMVLEVRQEA